MCAGTFKKECEGTSSKDMTTTLPAPSDSSVTLDTPCAAYELDVRPDSVTAVTFDDAGCASTSHSDTHPTTTSATHKECVQHHSNTKG